MSINKTEKHKVVMNAIDNKTTKKGLLKLGYVANLKICKAELNEMLAEDKQVSTTELNAIVDNARIVYLNRHGYPENRTGEIVTSNEASYLYFEIGLNHKMGEPIIGWFERKSKEAAFKGVYWGSKTVLDDKIRINKMFHWGDLYFKSEDEGLAFLEDIAASTIPENWSFKNKPSTINHPILKSLIENTLVALKREVVEKGAKNKFIYSKDGKYLIFNTNLLDKFSNEILIVVEVCRQKDGSTLFMNPRRIKKELELCKLGFAKNAKPEQPRFFEKIEDVIFQPSWQIDKDYDAFKHIIIDRIDRFPVEIQSLSSEELGKKLKDAITFAVAIAQRNYKFIVPMYRPKTGDIQLLMPIYLKGTYSSKPDFALILTPDRENEFYIPETILPLDAVYQNARLIAKPDDTWLNPETIL